MDFEEKDMALGVSILNRKYRYEKREEQGGEFTHVYLGLGGTSEYSITNHPIPSGVNRLVVFFQDPQSQIWSAAYFEKHPSRGQVRGIYYDGVVDEVVRDQAGVLGPDHQARCRAIKHEVYNFISHNSDWFLPDVQLENWSIATIDISGPSANFCLGWAEYVLNFWPIHLTEDHMYTRCMAAAWGALANTCSHDAHGGDLLTGTNYRWPEIMYFRYRCIAAHQGYIYEPYQEVDPEE